jgi:hypothetical protein
MGWRFVRQPNGLLARFSDVVDHFTHFNLTEAEAMVVCKLEYSQSHIAAQDKVLGGLEDWKGNSRINGSGTDRWEEALRIVGSCHGEDEAAKALSAVSDDGDAQAQADITQSRASCCADKP